MVGGIGSILGQGTNLTKELTSMVGGISSILGQVKILAPHTQKPKHNNPHVLPLKKKKQRPNWIPERTEIFFFLDRATLNDFR